MAPDRPAGLSERQLPSSWCQRLGVSRFRGKCLRNLPQCGCRANGRRPAKAGKRTIVSPVDTFPKSAAAECYRGFRLAGSCARSSPVAERSVALLHALVLVRIAFSGISGANRTLTSFGSVVAIYARKGTWRQNQVGQALTFTRWQLVTRLHLPSALPSIATGVHLALIYPWLPASAPNTS